MNAKQKQGMAALEEFLQEKYVEHYDNIGEDENKVEKLMSIGSYSDYFYIPVKEGIGSLKYVVDDEGHALYLIKKSGLPNEIKEELVGGDAGKGTYNDYFNLNDVYGVTRNLKIYYCNNGLDTIEGLAKESLDNDNPLREVFDEDSSNKFGILSKYDKDGDNKITAEEAKLVTTLTLKNSNEFENLSQLVNFVNLKELTLDNVNLESVNGLRNCPKLTYISFENYGGESKNVIKNYSEIKEVNKLQYLYLKSSDNEQVNSVFSFMSGVNYSDLKYLGVIDSGLTKNDFVTDISGLKNLSKVTKEAINYLYFYNNDISSIEALMDYINVRELNLSHNKSLTSLKGLDKMENLRKLLVGDCGLGKNEVYDVRLDNNGKNSLNDALASLENKNYLNYCDLSNNVNLKWISYLSNDLGLSKLFLSENTNIVLSDMVGMKDVYLRIDEESRKSFPTKYLSLFNTSDLIDYKGYEKNLSNNDTEILALLNNEDVEYLRLDGNTNLSDEATSDGYTLNQILSTCTNLKSLSLGDLTRLKSINFVSYMPNLKVLDLDGCAGISDLTLLQTLTEQKKLSLATLRINNSNIDLTKIQGVISALSGDDGTRNRFEDTQPELGFCASKSLYENLSKCTNLTKLNIAYRAQLGGRIDLSKCTKLTDVCSEHCEISFIFPSSLKELCLQHRSTKVFSDLSRCTKLTNIQLREVYDTDDIDGWINAMRDCSTLNSITITTYAICNQVDFGILVNCPVSTINISPWRNFISRWYNLNWS